jgi:hypothetical protein
MKTLLALSFALVGCVTAVDGPQIVPVSPDAHDATPAAPSAVAVTFADGSANQPNFAPLAIQVILTAYGLTDGPRVSWIEGHALDCAAGQAWDRDGECVDGSWEVGESPIAPVEVAFPEGVKFIDTALAHELCHYRTWALTGDADLNHTGECWQPNGLLSHAYDELRKAGI